MNARGEVIILHVSDLHRTAGATLSNRDLFGSLVNDVTRGYRMTNDHLDRDAPPLPSEGEIDLIVVSGDLTQSAAKAEFDEAEELLRILADRFVRGDRHRVVLVPGNHDIDWARSRGSYTEIERPSPEEVRQAQQHESLYRLVFRDHDPLRPVLARRDHSELHDERFVGYRDLLARFYDGAHSFDLHQRNEQFVIFDRFTEKLGLVFVGFNSCYLVDHLWNRGAIHRDAIHAASQELDRRGYGPHTLRIAVWHHNILGNPEHNDFMDPRTAILLAHHGFSLGLHGHVHATGQIEMTGAETALRVVWAGSLAAGHRERPPSVPMLYNVIGVHPRRRQAWVHTRSRRDEHEPWMSHAIWRARGWYRVDLGVQQAERIYANVSELQFLSEVAHLIELSDEITFVGTGLNVLQQAGIRDLIMRRAAEGKLRATICFGNPFAPHVRDRLVEEERCPRRPDVAANGIITRVESLLQAARDVPAVQVRLFNNYPTMSIFRFGNGEYVYYPMGYRKLGSDCPVMSLRRPSLYADFLDEMIANYLEDSVDAREVFRIRVDGKRTLDFVKPGEIRAVALYALPEKDSELHEHGCSLLGYDVLAAQAWPVNDSDTEFFRSFVGGAAAYGFHATIADLMYVSASQVESLMSEVREIVKGIRPFELQIERISEGYSPPWSLELVASELSGELEKLEAETALRILPLALGTNFTLDRVRTTHMRQMNRRAKTFCESYSSPHVLSEYRPHFTLASPGAVPNETIRNRLRRIVEERFATYLAGRERLHVDRLYFLQRPLNARSWDPIGEDNVLPLRH